jgi:TonB-dependent SusC/RagA subfamily outer membrane receptor
MLTVAYYFMQVILCSGMLLGYYWLVLRNKKFHQYNRFYLLGVGLLSWIVPLIKISFNQPVQNEPSQIVHLANIVASNNSEMEQLVGDEGFVVNWNMVAMTLYLTVCSIFLVWLITGLFKVYQLLKTYSCRNLGNVYLIMTNNVKGTPFSFFKYIFWNDAIDPNTETGQQIMQHELAHVREKHSIDKLFMQVVMMFGWFNPFFWLLKKELNLIHEFIADNKAVKDGDASSLAAMLLAAAYPNQQYILSNPFFFSPIKRRILMLTKNNNPRLSYARRLVVLPLLAVTVMLFAFRKKEATKNAVPLNKVYTVVIDAGHGGKDFGATATDGTKEKDLALLMLKAIKNANKNDKIKLIFTREQDVYQSPIEKAKFVNEQNADLFVSLHENWATKEEGNKTGFEIFVPKDDSKRDNVEASKLFAGSLESALLKSYKSNGIKANGKNIWVLKTTNCPGAIIECGFLSNTKDLALLKDEKQRNKMAELILEGIGNYLKTIELRTANNDENTIQEVSKANGNDIHNSNAVIVEGRTVTYKGEKLVSIKCTDLASVSFLLTSANHQWKVSLQELYDKLDKLEATSIKTNPESKKVELFRNLYIACLAKKEEAELQATLAVTAKKNDVNASSISMGNSSYTIVADSFTIEHQPKAKTDMLNALVIVDGTITTWDAVKSLSPNSIKTVTVLKGEASVASYGEAGKNGVVLITTKNASSITMLSPLNNSYITEKFGKNITESKITFNNDGIKICSKIDNKVKSLSEGTVSFVGTILDEEVVIVRSGNNL